MPVAPNITRIIESVFANRFGDDAEIVSVDVVDDIDSDGDPILRVQIVYEAKAGKLDAWKASGFLRYLRPKLEEAQENRFPIPSFILKSDYETLSPEAA